MTKLNQLNVFNNEQLQAKILDHCCYTESDNMYYVKLTVGKTRQSGKAYSEWGVPRV